MKKQLQGIVILLFAILLTLVYGNKPVFDLSLSWGTVFVILGVAGVVLAFCSEHDRK